ncbi:hypothetical protein GCK72_000313 [Caenorhabditis remanei]|uniref:W02B3.4-like N-terminal domain-containing protein n=1 Tax=Caenorhabditis remanei TaxID=31234 RepID=A0A6A5HMT2_CAERE|nr:hypothetical protein GCK72_000313 [Caenorhabditis remanei]KAF1768501.1 hypothetical protein GCK72_000313 [Caenorhabditis remanei]
MHKILWNKKSKPIFFRILVYGILFQIIFMLFVYKTEDQKEEPLFHEYDSTNNYMNVCSLPVYDYWHPSIKYEVVDQKSIDNCPTEPLTELVNGTWRILEKGMNCSARCLSTATWLPPGPVECEFVEAVCWEDSTEIYRFLHCQIIKPKIPPKFPENPPNVFVFLVDSLSTGAAKRSLPKTLSTLSSRLEAVEFPFVNKIGENSSANKMVLWFGVSVSPDVSILEEFKDHGYMTLHVDDENHQKGFKAHHYLNLNNGFCPNQVENYFKAFLEAYKGPPKFAWLSLTKSDDSILKLIENNLETLQNSFFIFMGAQGTQGLNSDSEIGSYQPADSFNNRTLLEISGERGHSYLRRQPSLPRTCGRLPIQPEYCICQVEKVPVVDENLRNGFGNLLVNQMNDLLDRSNLTAICEKFELRKTLSLLHHGHINPSDTNHSYDLTILTDFAQFKTILTQNKNMSSTNVFVRFLIFGIILQVVLLVLIYKNSKALRYSLSNNQTQCDDLLNEWDPEVPVLLIDLDFLENLKNQDCQWDETKRVKIGVHVKGKDRSIIDTTRFDVVLYNSPDGKDFLEFYEDGKRIIPKRFETRQVGNFEVPTNIQRFIEFYKRSKFVECLGLEMDRDTSEEIQQNGTTSTSILARFRDELIDMGMYPYLNGGTLLGWYRECTVIPHTLDLDFSVFKENYNPEYAEKVLRKNESAFDMRRMLGKLEDSHEITVVSKEEGRPAIDLFVMYDYVEDGKVIYRYIPGLDNDGTKYRFTHLLLDPACAAEMHGHLFWILCNPIEQLKHEYGPLWYRDHPTSYFAWNHSPKNIVVAGNFTEEEMEKYYLHF